jgi:hypothetical protein
VLKVIHHGNAPQAPLPPQPGIAQPSGRAAARIPGRPGPLPWPAGRRRRSHHAGGRPARREPGEDRLRRRKAATDLSKAPGGGRAPDLRARRCGGGPAIRPRTAGDDVPPRPRVRDGLDGVRAPAGA